MTNPSRQLPFQNIFQYKLSKLILETITIVIFLLLLNTETLHAKILELDLVEFINLVKEEHPEIKYKKFDPLIKRTSYEEDHHNSTYGSHIFFNYEQSESDAITESDYQTYSYGWKDKFIKAGTEININNVIGKRETATGPQWNSKVNFQVTQPLLRGGFFDNYNQRFLDFKKTEYLISESSYNLQLINYIKGALLNYWQYQANRERIRLTEKILNDSKKLLVFNKKRVKIGVVTESEILKSESEVMKNEVDLSVGKATVKKINETLKFMIGKSDDQDTDIVFTDTLDISPFKVDVEQAIDTALQNREELKTYAHRRELINSQLTIGWHSVYFPIVNTSLTYSMVGSGSTASDAYSSIGDNFGTMKGTDLTWSVYFQLETDVSAYDLAVKGRLQGLEQLDLEEKSFLMSIKNDIRQKYRDIQNQYEKVIKYSKAYELNNKIYDIGQKDYYIGKLDLNQHVQNKASARQSQIEYLNAKLSYWEAILNFKVATGTLLNDYSIEDFRVAKELKLEE